MFSSYEVRNEKLVTCQLQRRWSVQSNQNRDEIQMPAAGCEEDGGASQRPAGVQEQDAQLQVGEADVGHLSVSFNQRF